MVIPNIISRGRRVAYVPDDEADIRFVVGGVVYTYSSGLPFGDLTVVQFYRYCTTFTGTTLALDTALKVVGLKVSARRRVRRLSVSDYRLLQIAVKIGGGFGGVVVECLGLRPKDFAKIKRVISRIRRHGYSIELVYGAKGVSGIDCKPLSKRGLDRVLAAHGMKFVPVRVE